MSALLAKRNLSMYTPEKKSLCFYAATAADDHVNAPNGMYVLLWIYIRTCLCGWVGECALSAVRLKINLNNAIQYEPNTIVI